MTALSCVTVTNREDVVPRGHRRVDWFVQRGADWVAATQWPQAEVDDRDAGPGIVWERRVSLLLPVGTVLLRLETRPSRAPARSPLDYLTRELKTAERQTLRTRWIVGPRGSLASQTAR